MRKQTSIMLVVVALIAGCTNPLDGGGGGGGDSGPAVNGLVIHQAELVDKTITAGGSTRLVVRLSNTNRHPVSNVQVSLSNFGDSGEDVSPTLVQSDGTSADDGATCDLGAIAAASEEAATTALCAWRLGTATENFEQQETFPIGVTVTYDTNLTMLGETLKFTFEDQLSTTTPRVKRSYTNGELRMRTEHPAHVRTDQKQMLMDVTVENVGSGEILPPSDESGTSRKVTFSFGGSLVTGNNAPFKTKGCSEAVFLPDRTVASMECTLNGEAGPDGSTYTLGITAAYTYQRYKELPLTVTPVGTS